MGVAFPWHSAFLFITDRYQHTNALRKMRCLTVVPSHSFQQKGRKDRDDGPDISCGVWKYCDWAIRTLQNLEGVSGQHSQQHPSKHRAHYLGSPGRHLWAISFTRPKDFDSTETKQCRVY